MAVGQAGGNIGQLFEEKGYDVLYLNTSKEDLKIIENGKYKYHISGGDGCNKDRKKAKQLVVDDFDQIIAEIEKKLIAEFLYVIFASGGGSGSGAGPMLVDLLTDERKSVGAITILPHQKESIKAQINSYECLSELESISNMASIFIIDNDKGEKLKLNQQFVEAIHSYLCIPENHNDIRGNIDPAEIEESLKAHGMAIIVRTPDTSASKIIQSIEESDVFAAAEMDRVIKYISLSTNSDVAIEDLEKVVGIPLDHYVTYNNQSTICCLSGMTYPISRIEKIQKIIEDNQETILRTLNSTKEARLKRGINFLDNTEEKQKNNDSKKPKSHRDILSKYL